MLIRFVAQRFCFPVVDQRHIFWNSASENAVRENWLWLKGMHRSVGQEARLKVLHFLVFPLLHHSNTPEGISKNKQGELSLGVDRSLVLGSGFFIYGGKGK
jgi:hypothetical protein